MSSATRFVPVLALVLAVSLGITFTVFVVLNQPEHLFPAPLLWIAAWSLAPALAVIGTRGQSRQTALALTAVAFVVDAMSIISLGGGLIFALFVSPLLLITLVLIAREPRDSWSARLG